MDRIDGMPFGEHDLRPIYISFSLSFFLRFLGFLGFAAEHQSQIILSILNILDILSQLLAAVESLTVLGTKRDGARVNGARKAREITVHRVWARAQPLGLEPSGPRNRALSALRPAA